MIGRPIRPLPVGHYTVAREILERVGPHASLAAVGVVLVLGLAGTTGGMLWAMDQRGRAEAAEEVSERALVRANEVNRLITEMLGRVNPASTFNSVVFPDPDGPRSVTNSPGSILKLTLSSATTPLKFLHTWRITTLPRMCVSPRGV